MKIKIQSISDVITNSSTEAFIVYSRHDLVTVKKIIDSVLAINSNDRFDDLFTAKMGVYDYAIERIMDDWESWRNYFHNREQPKNYEDLENRIYEMSDADVDKLASEFDNSHWDSCVRFYDGFIIKAKQNIESHQQAADAIARIASIFDTDYCYG